MTASERSGKWSGSFCFLREEKVVEGLGVGIGGQRCALLRGQLDNAVPALGGAHNATDGGEARAFEGARDDAVGGNHELFNERRRPIFYDGRDADDLIGNQHGLSLDGLEFERAVLKAAALHALRGGVLQLELRGEVRAGGNLRRRRGFAFEPRADARVRQLRAVAHQCAVGFFIGSDSIGVDQNTRPPRPRDLHFRSER